MIFEEVMGVVVEQQQQKKKRQFRFLRGPYSAVENRRRDQYQYNHGRHGWRVRDGNIPGLVFGRLDQYQSTLGKLW